VSESKTGQSQVNKLLIGELGVDFVAGTISDSQSTLTLEPKVMQVLAILAENAGEIISQEAIFEQVWPNSIFSPSSIQRCIAVLRKAMNDDAKAQNVIKTHPKRGYCLLLNVEKVQASEDQQLNTESAEQKQTTKHKVGWRVSTIGLFGLLLLLYSYLSPLFMNEQGVSPAINVTLSPLSASEQNDYQPQFSPNGRFLAYLQSSQQVHGQLWLQNQGDLQHQALTDGTIEVLSYDWSLDGNSMLLLARKNRQFKILRLQIKSDNTEAVTAQSLFELHPLIHLDGLVSAHNLQWDGESTIYYIAEREGALEVVQHHLVTGKVETIESEKGSAPYALALSKDRKQLAIVLDDSQSISYLSVMNISANDQSTHDQSTGHPAKIAVLGKGTYEVDWYTTKQNEERWLINSGKSLFFLDKDGNRQPIHFQSLSDIEHAKINHQGQIALTLTAYDKDIWLYDTQTQQEHILVNSSMQESSARLSNSGKQVAFISERSGFPQVFIKHKLSIQAIEKLIFANTNQATKISWPIWSDNDTQLWFAVDGKLASLDIESSKVSYYQMPNTEKIVQITKVTAQAITLVYLSDEGLQYAEYDQQTSQIAPIAKIPNQQAVGMMKNGELYAMRLNQFYLQNGQDWQLIHDTQSDYVSMDIPCDHGLIYTAVIGHRTELRHFDISTQATNALQTYPSSDVLLMSVNADESKILLRKQQQESDIVLLDLE
jgi:DNA-binding winged helix-turn-helix (wHTH) protein/Tol biopolymer transport system component